MNPSTTFTTVGAHQGNGHGGIGKVASLLATAQQKQAERTAEIKTKA